MALLERDVAIREEFRWLTLIPSPFLELILHRISSYITSMKSWSLVAQLQVQWRTRISLLDLRSASHRARSLFGLFCSCRQAQTRLSPNSACLSPSWLTESWPVSTCRPIYLTTAVQLSPRLCLLIYVPAQSCGVMSFASNPCLVYWNFIML